MLRSNIRAVANLDVVCALREAARDQAIRFHTGVVQSKDSFYGQHEPQVMPVDYMLLQHWGAWKKMGMPCIGNGIRGAVYRGAVSSGALRRGISDDGKPGAGSARTF